MWYLIFRSYIIHTIRSHAAGKHTHTHTHKGGERDESLHSRLASKKSDEKNVNFGPFWSWLSFKWMTKKTFGVYYMLSSRVPCQHSLQIFTEGHPDPLHCMPEQKAQIHHHRQTSTYFTVFAIFITFLSPPSIHTCRAHCRNQTETTPQKRLHTLRRRIDSFSTFLI